jgi:hypothetical protein
MPNFVACNNENEHAAAKITHTILLKMRKNAFNMNATLIDTLLSLIPTAFKLPYKKECMMNLNPNIVFLQCFDWFIIKYGHTSAEVCKTNWMAIAPD